MTQYAKVSYKDAPDEFILILENSNGISTPSLAEFKLESEYRLHETGEGFADISFFVVSGGTPQALILAHNFGDFIGFNGSGAEIHSIEYNKNLITFILDQLIGEAQSSKCKTLKIDDQNSHGVLSILGQEIYNKKGVPHSKLSARQDITQTEDDLHQQLRKSYKSLINQGRREINFEYFDQSNITDDIFQSFKNFHIEIAGRQTRSNESWQSQFEMVKIGCADLIMGYMDKYGLVSSALFVDYARVTSYAVAVYNRDLFDKPLAHANVYEGMMRAKARGKDIFNLGIIMPYNAKEEKKYNIGKFKKGFCRDLSPFIEWSIVII